MAGCSACPSIRGVRTSRVRQVTGTTCPAAGGRPLLGRKTPARSARRRHTCGRFTSSDDRTGHLALAVTSLAAAKDALDQRDIPYIVQTAAVGAEQVFFFDPFGNQIELQEARED